MAQAHLDPFNQPLNVETIDGEVVVTADATGLAVALTPAAALETARRLTTAAHKADAIALSQPDQASHAS